MRLQLTSIRVIDLPDRQYTFVIGKQSPYLEFKLGRHEQKTEVAKNTDGQSASYDPVTFDEADEGANELEVTVYNSHTIRPATHIAHGSVALSRLGGEETIVSLTEKDGQPAGEVRFLAQGHGRGGQGGVGMGGVTGAVPGTGASLEAPANTAGMLHSGDSVMPGTRAATATAGAGGAGATLGNNGPESAGGHHHQQHHGIGTTGTAALGAGAGGLAERGAHDVGIGGGAHHHHHKAGNTDPDQMTRIADQGTRATLSQDAPESAGVFERGVHHHRNDPASAGTGTQGAARTTLTQDAPESAGVFERGVHHHRNDPDRGEFGVTGGNVHHKPQAVSASGPHSAGVYEPGAGGFRDVSTDAQPLQQGAGGAPAAKFSEHAPGHNAHGVVGRDNIEHTGGQTPGTGMHGAGHHHHHHPGADVGAATGGMAGLGLGEGQQQGRPLGTQAQGNYGGAQQEQQHDMAGHHHHHGHGAEAALTGAGVGAAAGAAEHGHHHHGGLRHHEMPGGMTGQGNGAGYNQSGTGASGMGSTKQPGYDQTGYEGATQSSNQFGGTGGGRQQQAGYDQTGYEERTGGGGGGGSGYQGETGMPLRQTAPSSGGYSVGGGMAMPQQGGGTGAPQVPGYDQTGYAAGTQGASHHQGTGGSHGQAAAYDQTGYEGAAAGGRQGGYGGTGTGQEEGGQRTMAEHARDATFGLAEKTQAGIEMMKEKMMGGGGQNR